MSPKLLIDDHFDIIECHVGGKIKHYERGPMGCAPYIRFKQGGGLTFEVSILCTTQHAKQHDMG